MLLAIGNAGYCMLNCPFPDNFPTFKVANKNLIRFTLQEKDYFIFSKKCVKEGYFLLGVAKFGFAIFCCNRGVHKS